MGRDWCDNASGPATIRPEPPGARSERLTHTCGATQTHRAGRSFSFSRFPAFSLSGVAPGNTGAQFPATVWVFRPGKAFSSCSP